MSGKKRVLDKWRKKDAPRPVNLKVKVPRIDFEGFNQNHARRGDIITAYTYRYSVLEQTKVPATDKMEKLNEDAIKALEEFKAAQANVERKLSRLVVEFGKTLKAKDIKLLF